MNYPMSTAQRIVLRSQAEAVPLRTGPDLLTNKFGGFTGKLVNQTAVMENSRVIPLVSIPHQQLRGIGNVRGRAARFA